VSRRNSQVKKMMLVKSSWTLTLLAVISSVEGQLFTQFSRKFDLYTLGTQDYAGETKWSPWYLPLKLQFSMENFSRVGWLVPYWWSNLSSKATRVSQGSALSAHHLVQSFGRKADTLGYAEWFISHLCTIKGSEGGTFESCPQPDGSPGFCCTTEDNLDLGDIRIGWFQTSLINFDCIQGGPKYWKR